MTPHPYPTQGTNPNLCRYHRLYCYGTFYHFSPAASIAFLDRTTNPDKISFQDFESSGFYDRAVAFYIAHAHFKTLYRLAQLVPVALPRWALVSLLNGTLTLYQYQHEELNFSRWTTQIHRSSSESITYTLIDSREKKIMLGNARDVMAQIEHEDMAFMYLIRSEDWVVLLDEHGRDIRSEQMAELIADAGNTGSSSLLFCIGGPYGHGRQLRKRANVSIKLSSLVLNHQIALVVLMEQLYRAWTILKGQKYHH
ncbi:hypothetical protein F0562_013324 [Nyssa sinensis]|uniref:Uncharacterized protein n=1 Tax=Nyssa sinensis TaxID=561372 RepID=A0A5J4ZN39_9ASTE|nr:hypothetical protein F0562_013324 [Nyssa sinensis]